jgi:hypothetical protein
VSGEKRRNNAVGWGFACRSQTNVWRPGERFFENEGFFGQDSLVKWPPAVRWRPMRRRFEVQLALGRTPIERIHIPLKSRDELPPILAGLQWVFQTPEVNEKASSFWKPN